MFNLSSSTGARTPSHLNFTSFPVDFQVVLHQPLVAKDNGRLASVREVKLHLLAMILVMHE